MSIDTDDSNYVPGAWVLEELIRIDGDDPRSDAAVRRCIASGTVLLALGEIWPDGPELLHCEVPVRDATASLVPVFTRLEYVDAAIAMNPWWEQFDVLDVEGAAVLHALGRGEWLGINLWSGHEFKLPGGGGRHCR